MTTTNSQIGPVLAPPSEGSTAGSAGTSAPAYTEEQVAALNADLAVGPELTPSEVTTVMVTYPGAAMSVAGTLMVS